LKDAQRSQSAQFRRAIEEEKRKRNSEMGKVIANNKAAQKEHKRILDSLNSVLRDKQRTIQTLIRKLLEHICEDTPSFSFNIYLRCPGFKTLI
uniref:V-type proton ATPase subunit G n=1 Tax=Toxocara canis TaxID=6265 RepID=A0A183UR29_TOXCA